MIACLWCSVRRCVKQLGKRFGEMLCKIFFEMLDPNMLHIYLKKTSRRIQESLNLSQLPSPDEGLVSPKEYYTNHKLFFCNNV